MRITFLLVAACTLLCLGITPPLFAESFTLQDGSVEEGTVLRMEGQKVSIMTSTGVSVYDLMDFDENTRTQHFSALLPPPEQDPDLASPQTEGANNKNPDETPPSFIQVHWPLLNYIRFYSIFPMLLFGGLLCFFGLRFYRQLMATSGVILGLTLGWLIAVPLLKLENDLLAGLIMLAAAIIMGFIFLSYVYLIVVLYGAIFGLLLTIFIVKPLSMIGIENLHLNTALLLILPIVGAVLAFTNFKVMLILATACMGSTQVVNAAYILGASLLKGILNDSPDVIMPLVLDAKETPPVLMGLQIGYVIIFILGVIFQRVNSKSGQHADHLPQSFMTRNEP
ncbi:DUF4203 domain-containing protein [Kiritimatiellota bacterium B12222]|nr:DUF4203 domain-containing protein [Kiritimatiellota bacterium B12222]